MNLTALDDFIASDPMVLSKYLLFGEMRRELDSSSVESKILFLLWFIVSGRHEHVLPLIVPAAVRDIVTVTDHAGIHMLMQYIADQELSDPTGASLRSWYYLEVLVQRKMGPFLTHSDLDSLKALPLPELRDDEVNCRTTVASVVGKAKHIDILSRLVRRESLTAGAAPLPSVSIVGYHRAVLGLGEDARCLFECLCELGIAAELVDASPESLETHDALDQYAAFETPRPTGTVVIFCLPPLEMVWAMNRLGLARPMSPHHWVGFWPWETSRLPSAWSHVYDLVDEVWASTTFLRRAFEEDGRKQVIDMPPYVNVETPVRSDLFTPHLGSSFTFLSIFDFNSRIRRKNPLGAIQAFRRAFGPEITDVRLLLKSLHASTRPNDFIEVSEAIAGDDRIVLVDTALPKSQLCDLVARADIFVSLHRAEGFGRPIAEAMLLGTPVIATGWSGSSDFLNTETGFPVRATLRPVQVGEYPFASGAWAEPDLDHAAELMVSAYRDRMDADRRASKARAFVASTYGRTMAAQRFGRRLDEIASFMKGSSR